MIKPIDFEQRQLMRIIKSLSISCDDIILDVGCGEGRNLSELNRYGYSVIGVDINPRLVEINRSKGFRCYTVSDFHKTKISAAVVLMSHIIEHFSPADLKQFLDTYLRRLLVNGHLIIATPLGSPYFYDDFDHIRPYHPQGIIMVYGKYKDTQVQYYSQHKLKIVSLWYRRSPYGITHSPGRYIGNSISSYIFHVINIVCTVLYNFTRSALGRKDAWLGVFKKV